MKTDTPKIFQKKYGFNSEIARNGIARFKINKKILDEIKKIIGAEKKFYKKNLNLSELTLKLQDQIKKKKIHLKIFNDNKKMFLRLLRLKNINDLLISTTIYLRITKKNSDVIPFHRENFYNDFDYINNQLNINIPISDHGKYLYYIEKSHLITDKEIKFVKINSKSSNIKRFSTSHKIGLPYNPKIIQNLNELGKLKMFNSKICYAHAFSSRLLHGNGINNTDKVRISLDFGIIPKNENSKKNKKFHFASYHVSKKHYLTIAELNS